MNALLPRFLKLAYRREPISSFIVIVGAVDTVIGGAQARWSLFAFGLIMLVMAALVRWLKAQKAQNIITEQPARYFLPDTSSRTALPILSRDKHRS
jgi:hypothetical protein